MLKRFASLLLVLAFPCLALAEPLVQSVLFVGQITHVDDSLREVLDPVGVVAGVSLTGTYSLVQVPDAKLAIDEGLYPFAVRLLTLVAPPVFILTSDATPGGGSVDVRNGPTSDEYILTSPGVAEGVGGNGFGSSVTIHLVNVDGSAFSSDAMADPSNGQWDVATGRYDGQLGGFDFTIRFVPKPFVDSLACRADLNADGVVNFADLGRMKSVFFQSCAP